MIRIAIDRSWHVRLVGEFDLTFDAASAWLSLRDFHRFACQDMFHRSVVLDTPRPVAGASLVLDHRLLGIGFARVGRILHWHEGRSYAFSDLSRRDPRKGFPHIYIHTLDPIDAARCRFRLEVRGLWTARFLGRTLTRGWLAWIMLKTTLSIRNAFLVDAVERRTKLTLPSRRSSYSCTVRTDCIRSRRRILRRPCRRPLA